MNYVENGVAAGEIAVSGGASRSGGQMVFPLTQSTVDDSFVGTASYAGSVNFWGHSGELDLTFSDPQVSITSESTAFLSVLVAGERVTLATVDLSGATRTTDDDMVTWTGAPAVLTADGTQLFAYQGHAFYPAGTALDALTFTASYSAAHDGSTGDDAGGGAPGDDAGSGAAAGDGVTDSVTTVGSLRWGVKASFRSYVTGPIASGAYTASSGATYSGGQFVFLQDGGAANATAGTGTATYDGAVRFVGHGGILDLTLADPSVTLTSTTKASLTMTVNGARATIATLNLAAGVRSVSNGAVTYSNVPTTLTAAGSVAFSYNGSGFYAAGTAMDPVTVTFGAASTTSPTSTQSIGEVALSVTAPEVTAGEYEPLALDPAVLDLLVNGGLVSISVTGFTPGEGVQVALFSDPLVLAEGVADANGAFTWTGSLPASYVGDHELVFIGGESGHRVGIAVSVPDRSTVAGMCVVEGGELTWAFKDSFLSYIDSSIANGSWEVAGGVEDLGTTFTWPLSAGSIDTALDVGTASFAGEVHFTGHEGVLDTTIANPAIEFSADGTYLLLDLVTTTQEGEAVEVEQVRFAELDLDGGSVSADDGTVTLTDVPATLTDLGSEAFGTYASGEELAAVSAVFTSADNCAAVLAGVEGPVDEVAEPTVAPTEEPTSTADDAGESGSSAAGLWWVLAGVALVAAAGAALVMVRARRVA